MKIRKQLITCIAGIISLGLHAQEMQWGGRFGGIGEDVVRSMQVDGLGNTYVTGYYTDTSDFDIGAGEELMISNGFYDVYVSKHDSEGNFEWVRGIGGTGFDYAVAINFDDLGNVYVTGAYEGTVDFDPGAGEYLLSSLGSLDIFILKLDAQGEFMWARSVGGVDYEEATDIDITPLGDVVVLGYLYQEVDFDPGPGTYNLNSVGGSDSFILTLNSSGDFESAKRFGGPDLDLAMDMVITDTGELYITGFFEGTADMDPHDLNVVNVTAEPNSLATYLLYLDNNGDFLNVVHTRGGNALPQGLDVDNNGNAYITGSFDGTTNFDPDPMAGNEFEFESPTASNAFLMKLDASGELSWARQIASAQPVFGYDIVVNSLGTVYSTGYFEGSADFDPSSNEFLLSQESSNAMDAYLSILNTEGNFIGAYALGGVNFIDTNEIGVDALDNVYLAAHFEATVDLDPDPAQFTMVSSEAFRDNYIIQLNSEILGTTDYSEASYILAPNPADDYIVISGFNDLYSSQYRVVDLQGRTVLTGIFNESATIDVSSLRSGVYIIQPHNLKPMKFLKK
jgi:hypothetical protein